MTACCSSERLCTLKKTDNGITYLTAVRLRSHSTEDESFYLLYSTEHRSRGFSNFIKGVKAKDTFILHVIPDNGRFRLESLLTSSNFYEYGKNIGHAEPNGEWYSDGYSDDKDSESAKVLKYFNEHKGK